MIITDGERTIAGVRRWSASSMRRRRAAITLAGIRLRPASIGGGQTGSGATAIIRTCNIRQLATAGIVQVVARSFSRLTMGAA